MKCALELHIEDCLLNNRDEAIRLISKNYSKALIAKIRSFGADGEDAKDILQESLVVMWRYSHLYKPEGGKLYSWLVAVVRQRLLSHNIDSKAKKRDSSKTCSYDIDTHIQLKPSTEGFDPNHIGIVKDLEKIRYGKFLYDFYISGYSLSELSKYNGISKTTVSANIQKGLLEMKKKYRLKASV